MRVVVAFLMVVFLVCAPTIASTSTITFQGTATVETPDDPAHDSILSQLADIVSRLIGLETKIDALGVPVPPPVVWDPIVPGTPLSLTDALPAARGPLPTAILTITQMPNETLAELGTRVRSEKAAVSGPGLIVVVLRAGIHYLETPLVLTSADSGTATNPILYTSPAGQWAHVSGTRAIPPSNFQPVTDPLILDKLHPDVRTQVRQVDLSSWTTFDFGTPVMVGDTGEFTQRASDTALALYMDGMRQTVARWPNRGMTTQIGVVDTTRLGKFGYLDNRAIRWQGDPNVWIAGKFFYDWAFAYAPVDFIDPSTQSLVLRPHTIAPTYHQYGFKQGQPYYVLNALSELDDVGEWYLDRATKILYFYSPTPITNQRIELSAGTDLPGTTDHRFLIDSTDLAYVTFDHLVVEGGRGIQFQTVRANHVTFSNMVVRGGNSRTAIRCTDCTNVSVDHSEAYDLAAGFVLLENKTTNPRATLTSTNTMIEYNHLHHYAKEQKIWGILLDGVGVYVAHNEIHDAPDKAIQVSGNNHVIELNHIYDVVQEMGDSGAIYAGNDWSVRGTLVRNNYFQRIGPKDVNRQVQAVYLDDQLSGWTITGNIFEDGDRGIQLGGGRWHTIKGNIFTNNDFDIYMDARGVTRDMPNSQHWAKVFAQPYTVPPWSDQYPELINELSDQPGLPLHNLIDSNLYLGRGHYQSEGGALGYMTLTNNQDDTDVGYNLVLDAQYQLDAASLAAFPTFQQIPFSTIGRTTPMSALFFKTFSDALTGANGFDSVFSSNGTIAQSAGAGLNGTSGGVTVTRTANSPNAFGRITSDFTGKTVLRTAWYTDLSALTITTTNHNIALFRFDNGGATIESMLLAIKTSGGINLRHYLYNDSGTALFNEFALGTPEWIELVVTRATDGATADGSSQLYMGGGSYPDLGVLVSEHTGILNYTRFPQNKVLLGMQLFATGTSVAGSVVVDEWTLRDDDTPILFGVEESIGSLGMRYVLSKRRRN